MKIKLTISYDGTAYCGWQRQTNGVAVQQVVEEAVEKLTGQKVTVTGSGRTDSGVHAKAQVAHFLTDTTVPPERMHSALNVFLPDDVKIISAERADEGFHARFSAKKKTYSYNFYFSDVILPLKDRYATRVEQGLDFSS
ncbi:MAG: tRNA pseudouridine synthase A, partial [Clostridia bacterium]|nr:tRNA pseudouridine synthase A [Clostridia bacterium]